MAVYSLFDMMNVIFAAALKGAGDTRFPVAVTTALSWAVMVVPAYFLCVVGDAGVYTAWTLASLYIFLNGLVMLSRFRAGAWKKLRIIEHATPGLPLAVAE